MSVCVLVAFLFTIYSGELKQGAWMALIRYAKSMSLFVCVCECWILSKFMR